jgi:hypothetical protein
MKRLTLEIVITKTGTFRNVCHYTTKNKNRMETNALKQAAITKEVHRSR